MQPVFFTDRRKISDFKKTIKDLPKNSIVIIREYDLVKEEREIFAKEISTLSRAKGFKILVGKDLILAQKIKADGVHFSDFDKIPLQIMRRKNLILSLACHSLKSVIKARKLRPEMVFISPIFSTSSHQDTKSLGLLYLAKILAKNRKTLPIYALGGVNSSNIKALKKLGITGFGAINFFSKSS